MSDAAQQPVQEFGLFHAHIYYDPEKTRAHRRAGVRRDR